MVLGIEATSTSISFTFKMRHFCYISKHLNLELRAAFDSGRAETNTSENDDADVYIRLLILLISHDILP